MALTTFATNDNETKKVWDEKLFRDVEKALYFKKFMGSSAESIVHVKSQFEKEQGDRVRFALRMRLAGAGQTGSTVLEDNEEALSTHTCDLTLEQYRHAVRFRRGIDEQRAMFKIDPEARDAIKTWGEEKVDQLCFDALFDSTPSKVFYRDGTTGATSSTTTAATAKSALRAANSKISTNFISAVRTWAKTGGTRSGDQTPLRPIRVEGQDHYILLAHPDALYDLKIDSTYQSFVREAAERGKSNPLFTGAVAVIDGVVIHEHENCPIGTDGGAGAEAWSQAALLGAQSLVFAWGRKPRTIMKDFDYENQVGYAWDMVMGVTRPEFNSKDYGSMRMYLARTNVSGL